MQLLTPPLLLQSTPADVDHSVPKTAASTSLDLTARPSTADQLQMYNELLLPGTARCKSFSEWAKEGNKDAAPMYLTNDVVYMRDSLESYQQHHQVIQRLLSTGIMDDRCRKALMECQSVANGGNLMPACMMA